MAASLTTKMNTKKMNACTEKKIISESRDLVVTLRRRRGCTGKSEKHRQHAAYVSINKLLKSYETIVSQIMSSAADFSLRILCIYGIMNKRKPSLTVVVTVDEVFEVFIHDFATGKDSEIKCELGK